MEEFRCPICGKPTYSKYGNYRNDGLCAYHGRLAYNGEIEQCPNCGEWHYSDEECNCVNDECIDEYDDNDEYEDNSECLICGNESYGYLLCKSCYNKYKNQKIIIQLNVNSNMETKLVNAKDIPETQNKELTCIVCGKPSNGNHFCQSCFNKYKNREIEIHFKNCVESYISDKYCNKRYTCDDGRKVRSKSEKIISDFLFKYKIRAVYEKTVYYYTKNGDTIELHPDFYLPDYNIYIEHNGMDTQTYKDNKRETEQMYKEMQLNIIVTSEIDLEDIEKKLKPILKLN